MADLPVILLGRLRSDRVMLRDPGPTRSGPKGGRPRRHGGVLTFAKPDSWHEPDVTTVTDATRYGKAETIAWDRMHPRLTHRGPWLDHAKEELPILHGTLIRLRVERLPGDRDSKPVWLWCSVNAATLVDVDRWWQSFLRRFDLEHTCRVLKQTLGWTAPKVRHAWEKPAELGRLTPARVRRGFRNIRPNLPCPTRAPKANRPAPDGAPAPRTGDKHHVTTWEKPSNVPPASPHVTAPHHKEQAQ